MIVVFDIGNVLVRWDRRYLYRKVFDDEERMERFLATALAMDFVSHTDLAEDFAGAVAARAKSFPEFAKELRMFHERWIETLGEPIEENVALLRRLRAVRQAGLRAQQFRSRNLRACRAQARFPERIRRPRHLGSCRLRQAGPAASTKSCSSAPGDGQANSCSSTTRSANVRASEALGMPAIHFGPGVDLEKELVARGALP